MASLFARPLLACLGAAALLAGCANPAAEEPPPPAFATAPAVMPAPAPAAPPVPPVAPAPTVPADGTVARFVGTATQLPAGTGALLDQLAQDKRTRWEIKGYSERQVNKTAREVALARALAVRKELVARGVPAQNLRVRYTTEEAREAVTVLPQVAEGKRAEAAPAPAPAPAPAKAPPAKR
ncbi:flagellar motor protein MotB [Acidovorax sp. FG27]|uniref:OmpA family protein n=1 Tax=Acidovorax sp. FG27 TaxID=3133652 RepID=UPI0030E9A95B